MELLAEDTGHIALMASRKLKEMLSREEADTKKARELSNIMKDMAALSREFGANEARVVSVEFQGAAEGASV